MAHFVAVRADPAGLTCTKIRSAARAPRRRIPARYSHESRVAAISLETWGDPAIGRSAARREPDNARVRAAGVRPERGRGTTRARAAPLRRSRTRDLQDGSDGTRTRDLRRDRPVKAQPAKPAATRNFRL